MIRPSLRTIACFSIAGLSRFSVTRLAFADFYPHRQGFVLRSAYQDNNHYRAARFHSSRNHYPEAIAECRKAIADDPLRGDYWDLLIYCLKQSEQYDEAISFCEQRLVWNPTDAYASRELGICYIYKAEQAKALSALQWAVWYDWNDFSGHDWLGYCLRQMQRYHEAAEAYSDALALRPNNFNANYGRGISSYSAGDLDEAVTSLGKAVKLRAKDFEANLWLGYSLSRQRKMAQAIPYLEKAHALKPTDRSCQKELFACYLASRKLEKAAALFRAPFIIAGAVLTFLYLVGLALLLPFSVKVRESKFPGLRFSISWLLLFVEGQIAFLVLCVALFPLGDALDVLIAAALAGLPIIIVAVLGFARQPWGGPFRWPQHFGGARTVALVVVLQFLLLIFSAAFGGFYFWLMHRHPPMQSTLPLIKQALRENAVLAWTAAALLVPLVEEILFRGLFFTALLKRWRTKTAIVGSAFVFALVHLQLVGFFYLFSLGLILGWARHRTGTLALPLSIHATNNALALLALMFSSHI